MKKDTISILILHGWRLYGGRYKDLKKEFEKLGYRVYSPDLPGFGANRLTKQSLTLEDFADFVDSFITKNKLHNVVVVAHSFGGRVMAKYFNKYKNHAIKAIILTGTPLVRENMSFRKHITKNIVDYMRLTRNLLPRRINVFLSEKARFLIYRIIGEMDYYKAGDLQKTLVNILEDNPEKYISDITTPTLIVWGEDDRVTPVGMAFGIHNKIKESQVVVVSGETHKLPYEQPKKFAAIVDSFITDLS